VSARLRASVGLSERTGLLVRSVDPAGAAAAAGVQVGDLVVGAAGTEVTTVHDLHEALDAATDALELRIVRGTEELTVSVAFTTPEESSEGTS
jgi:serine protease Do